MKTRSDMEKALALRSEGKSYQEIADTLGFSSTSTVSSYLWRIRHPERDAELRRANPYSKRGAQSRIYTVNVGAVDLIKHLKSRRTHDCEGNCGSQIPFKRRYCPTCAADLLEEARRKSDKESRLHKAAVRASGGAA